MTRTYDEFWAELTPAYPISKGSLRLPISTSLTDLPGFDRHAILSELRKILQSLLDTEGTLEKAVKRAQTSGDSHIVPLISNEYTGIVRFDCIWQPETGLVKILEINCDYPDGLLLHDATYSALTENHNQLHQSLFKKLFTSDESVHVLFSKKATFIDSYHAEYASLSTWLDQCSISQDVTDINPNTTVRRCLETTKIDREDVEKLTDRSLRFINSFALRTLGYKDLLETLDHDFIPSTVRVNQETAKQCVSNQHALVLKPIDGCEGHGIYFGNKMGHDTWTRLIHDLANQNYIAQELVTLPKQLVSFYENGGVTTKELYFDLCPHFFIKNGEIYGNGHILTRFSENQIVNVAQGGGIGYCIID